jgi:5-formyltetrahydrofolate cyclo-ligase
MLSRRHSLTKEERRVFSECIVEWFLRTRMLTRKLFFFVYCDVRSEVRTGALVDYCLGNGKLLAVPKTDTQAKRLQVVRVTNPIADLCPGYLGIPEPRPGLLPHNLLAPERIDVAVVPGVAFDRMGNRLGYGGGYYDRFLREEAPGAIRVGFAFSTQVVPSLSLVQAHDVPMDILVTEEGISLCSGGFYEQDSCL